jgi:nucleoside-diphosphate-sugar epimerase
MRWLRADRERPDEMASVLAEARFDAVIDTSGQSVAATRIAADLLRDIPRYVFVSTLDVYRGWPPGPILSEEDPTHEEESEDYGPAKAGSERVLATTFGERLLAVRPGVIVGPGEVDGRLPAWLRRLRRGGRVVVPDALEQPIAFIDVRDLAGWLADAVEQNRAGVVNATGPAGMTTYGGLLTTCLDTVAEPGTPAAELVPVPEEELLAAEVKPWRHLPFWVPATVAPTFWQVGTDRARQWGLPSRPVRETVADTWAWLRTAGPTADEPRYGLPEELEQKLLTAH